MVDDRGNGEPEPSDPAKINPSDQPSPEEPELAESDAATQPDSSAVTSPAEARDGAGASSHAPVGVSEADDADDAADPTEAIPRHVPGGTDPWEGTEDDIFQLTGDSAGQPTQAIRPVPDAPDATAVMPPATEEPRWSARAGVPASPRGAAPPEDWQRYDDPHGGRTWWLPIALGILALLLLAAVAIGIWLIQQNRNTNDHPTPTPTATTPSPTPTTPSPSPSQTSASPSPSSVVLANLIGMTEQQAIEYLDANGLQHTSVPLESPAAPPGTVLVTDPSAGAIVASGSLVTLTIAVAPATPTPTESIESPTPDATTTP